MADAIPLTMPLGVNAFMKGGSIDFAGEHALSIAGGVFIPPRRWMYYGLMINWLDAEAGDVAAVQLRAPEGFAIDYVQLDAQGRLFVGHIHKLENWHYFGAEVIAAAPAATINSIC